MPEAMPVCGGTNLIVDVRDGKLKPEILIDLSGVSELKGISVAETEIIVRAGTTIAELLACSAIEEHAAVLSAACQTFANALVRNRATIGGNLINAGPCADTAPALLVLNADVTLASVSGTRRMPLSEFLLGAFQTARRPDELLTEIAFAIPPKNAASGFRKMGLRRISCMAKVDLAVYVERDEAGLCQDVRIAQGAASAIAIRVPEAEAALTGGHLTTDRIDEAARLAEAAAQPRAGSEYKRQVVHGLTRSLLTEIMKGEADGA